MSTMTRDAAIRVADRELSTVMITIQGGKGKSIPYSNPDGDPYTHGIPARKISLRLHEIKGLDGISSIRSGHCSYGFPIRLDQDSKYPGMFVVEIPEKFGTERIYNDDDYDEKPMSVSYCIIQKGTEYVIGFNNVVVSGNITVTDSITIAELRSRGDLGEEFYKYIADCRAKFGGEPINC